MAADSLLKTGKHSKYISYRKILYHRFFVGLLLFILVTLAITVLFNALSSSSPRTVVHEAVNLDRSVVVKLGQDAATAQPRDANCTYWECFNVYRCGRGGHNKITIYIYPRTDFHTPEGPISKFSREFYVILDTIRHSKYYTANPEEACLLIPSIDTLNQRSFLSKHVSQAFYSLSHWNNGENHLIFNMLPGSAPNYETVLDLKTGKAIIAGAGFDTWSFRYGFDVAIPVYSPLAAHIDGTQPDDKKSLILSTQLNIPRDYLSILQNIASSSNDLILLDRCKSADHSKRCEYVTGRIFNYPEVLKNGMFCLVIRSARLSQAMLMDMIASQCIPIIVADSIVMPFNSHVDWNKIAIFVPEENLKNVLKIVHAVSQERRGELYWQQRWVYERYFSSIQKITMTMLEIINEKVFPLAARSYEDWNMPEHLYGPVNPLFLPVTAPKGPGFTAVILTYDRVDSLFTLVRKLVRTPSLAKILVVWNNQRKAPPPSSEWPVINKPLKVIRTKENKLSNRFFPYDEIETECQLTIDDDIVMLTPDELEFGFDVWREFPDRIVGFPSRLHVWDNGTHSWRYHSEWTNQISMVLTGAAFHHKIWSWYYTYRMPAAVRSWVDDNFNCEDIAMNFLVANVTGKPPIKVTPRKKFKCPECTNTEMLSADARHMTQRSACIQRFTQIYGHMALKSVEFRADPLQYMENSGIPHMYPDIGML
ncbi:exostosin-2 [Leguminivora glycinivorella]|uniref:exostosin-2 n=1 Tax=Leguminivora glycinivorella TaxID=1035111 RepID=UPI00200D5C14|nr:exostosin-2 [Leguminivora glycinivorella]